MHRYANVMIAVSDAPLLDRLSSVFCEDKFRVTALPDVATAKKDTGKAAFDLAVIEYNRNLKPAELEEIFGPTPFILIGTDDSPDTLAKAGELGADDVFTWGTSPQEMIFRMTPLLRLSTMRSELRRRKKLALAAGLHNDQVSSVDVEEGAHPASILVVTPDLGGDDEALLQKLQGDSDNDIHTCDSLFEAETVLEQKRFDLLFLGTGSDREDRLNFCDGIRQNPSLYNLPIGFLSTADSAGQHDPLEPYVHGTTRHLVYPVRDDLLQNVTTSLIRRNRRRWVLGKELEAICQGSLKESETGLFTYDFLLSNLTDLIEETDGKRTSLAFFSVPAISELAQQFGEDASADLRLRIARWIKGMIRAEDLAAPYGKTDFAVILPDSSEDEAETFAQRIAGILTYTDFAVAEVYQPVTVSVEICLAGLRAGESASALVMRARESLE
ncbi:MAG: diguanylate cyclase [Rhodospirillales bacterium]|nr:diguanylate cyclase [Rhodospirillales bacterium]